MKYKKYIFLLILTILSLSLLVIRLKEIEILPVSVQNKFEILVDVEESKLYLFENGMCSKIYKCSGGKITTPSPIGTWRIKSKRLWGEGFGGYWMRI